MKPKQSSFYSSQQLTSPWHSTSTQVYPGCYFSLGLSQISFHNSKTLNEKPLPQNTNKPIISHIYYFASTPLNAISILLQISHDVFRGNVKLNKKKTVFYSQAAQVQSNNYFPGLGQNCKVQVLLEQLVFLQNVKLCRKHRTEVQIFKRVIGEVANFL